jgi:hypothetical protein
MVRRFRRALALTGLLSSLLLSALAASPAGVLAAVGPCGPGTAFFGSAPTDTKFQVGDTWQGATFTAIDTNDPSVNDVVNARIVVTGDQVGRFPSTEFGASATITFDQPVLVTGILWFGNHPNSGETGWTLNGIVGPDTGDDGAACQSVGFVTTQIVIASDESGGIDFWIQPVGDGCTPGYWKNHVDSWSDTGLTPGQTAESVFDIPNAFGLDNVSLLGALSLNGGPGLDGGARILLRAGVAALLNASSPGVDYGATSADVIADVNAALASGSRATMLAVAAELDRLNNEGCPLN